MLIQLPDFSWEVVEHCVPYFTKINYEEEIMECNGKPCMVFDHAAQEGGAPFNSWSSS